MIKTLLKRNDFTDILTTDDPFSVAAIFESTDIDLIVLDIKLTGMDGYGVMQSLKDAAVDIGREDSIPPVLVLTEIDNMEHRRRAIIQGANDYINFPFDKIEFVARVTNLLKISQAQKIILHQNEILEYKVAGRTKKLRETQDELHESRLEIVWRLGRAAEFRDNETGLHIIRMSKIACLLAQSVGLNDEEVDLILNASPMHDIGKLGIPDRILLKPGRLDDAEWEVMKTHTQIGADILSGSNSTLLELAHDIALSHHEKWDGTGYPNQISGDDISFAARVSAMADVFDALTSVRPYKLAWSVEDTMDYMRRESGTQFDPSLVSVLEKELPEVLKIKEAYSEPKRA